MDRQNSPANPVRRQTTAHVISPAVAALAALFLAATATAATITPGKVLFDATKAQMAGNADWVIDADTHNIGTGSSGAMVSGSGSESNPQRYPNPAASGITASTAETY